MWHVQMRVGQRRSRDVWSTIETLPLQRRARLSAVLSSSVVLSGCLDTGVGQGGEGTIVEISPVDRTNHQIALEVAVDATDDSLLLAHSSDLPAGHSDGSQGVEDRRIGNAGWTNART
jgi:hypothetical protein